MLLHFATSPLSLYAFRVAQCRELNNCIAAIVVSTVAMDVSLFENGGTVNIKLDVNRKK